MIELDSFNIIALEISLYATELETLELKFESIFTRVRQIESQFPNIEVSCDMMSLDAFRCEFEEYVVFTSSSIKLQNKNIRKRILERYLPEESVSNKLKPYMIAR